MALVVGAYVGLAWISPALAAAASSNKVDTALAALTDVELPKSKFEFDPNRGRDPFFPQRFSRVPTKPATTAPVTTTPTVTPVAAKPLLSRHLTLRGIFRSESRQLALISGQRLTEEFAVNQEKSVSTPEGPLKVRCVEIRDKSVVLAVEGEPERKELKLGEK